MGPPVSSIAVAIPHTPWIPERAVSLARVLAECPTAAVYSERAPNHQWSLDLWRGLLATGAEWCAQLQDDVLPMPGLMGALRGICASGTGRVYGLHSGHPGGPALAAQGRRWYRTRAWVVGVGYVLHRDVLAGLVRWREACEPLARATNEDDLIGQYLVSIGEYVYHPIPTVIDHDVTVASTYMNDAHALRRPSVLWHRYDAEAMQQPEFWRETSPPVDLVSPYACVCQFCGARARPPLCRVCIVKIVGENLGLNMQEQK